jgi:membrane-associated protease RseP (regulator of RpoE activity)
MRKNAALIAGLLLVTGLVGVSHVSAAAERTPWIGVYMQELTPQLREAMDYRGNGGVLLNGVVPDGPAAQAGLRKGDVVARVNSRDVDSPEGLSEMVRAARVGQSLSVEVFRDGGRRIVSVWPKERPEEVKYRVRRLEGQEPPEGIEAPETPGSPGPIIWHSRPSPDGKRRTERIIIRDLKDRGDLDEIGELEGLKGLKDLQGLKELRDLPGHEVFRVPGGGMGFLGVASGVRLGVRVEPLSPKLGDYFGLKDDKGVLVLEVIEDTPAEKAGLEPGDVITEVDGDPVANARDLVGALRGKEGKVALRVVRHGTPRTVEAELEGPGNARMFREQLGDRPGVQKRIMPRGTKREDLRNELDQVRKQLEELRQRLDEGQGGGDGEE